MKVNKNLFKWGWLSILFIFSYLLIATAATHISRYMIPKPYMGGISSQQEAFFQQKDDINLLFLGSSGFGSTINPIILDSEMDRLGCPIRSFNLSPDGLNSIETRYVLEQIIKSRPKKLSTIILDLPPIHYGFKQKDALRTRFFNTWSNFVPFVTDIWNLPRFRKKRALILLDFIISFAYERSGVGLLHSTFISPPEGYPPAEIIVRQRGYGGDLEKHIHSAEKSARLSREVAKLKKQIDSWKASYAEMNRVGHLARLKPVIDKVESYGFEVAVLLAPTMTNYSYAEPLKQIFTEKMPRTPMWHYNDFVKWPDFMDGANLRNITHMNPRGAVMFSKILAKDLCQSFKSGELRSITPPLSL
ncbi:MAG: hypothetical protein HQL70_04985 [Magnetococcales bacterium]|nr:hypothetical protein [Magnetococcales bacterium]